MENTIRERFLIKTLLLLSTFAVVCILLCLKIIPGIWAACAFLAFFFVKKENKLYYLISLAVSLTIGAFGIVNFKLFDQVRVLAVNSAVNPIMLLANSHPHALRFLITYPAVFASRAADMSFNSAFSFYVEIFILSSIITNLFILYKNINHKYSISAFIIIILAVVLLAHNMNGRILFSMCGAVLVLKIIVELLHKQTKNKQLNKSTVISGFDIFGIFIGILLTSVSSGTIMSVSLMAFIGLIICFIEGARLNMYSFIILLIGLLLFIPQYYMMNRKNLIYFGNDLFQMMNHGLGALTNISFALIVGALIAAIIIVPVYFVIIFNRFRINKVLGYLLLIIPFTLGCGVFGLSTATMIFPVLLVLFIFVYPKIVIVIKIPKNDYNKNSV